MVYFLHVSPRLSLSSTCSHSALSSLNKAKAAGRENKAREARALESLEKKGDQKLTRNGPAWRVARGGAVGRGAAGEGFRGAVS